MAASTATAVAAALSLLPGGVAGLENGLGVRPPMGYSTWNHLGCKGVTAVAIEGVADALVARGFDRLGYTYVNVDDCWAFGRDADGQLAPEESAFPQGMKMVADYVHARGLKFGLYTDRGLWTCGARPGSDGHEHQDAMTFASWGVDYLKVDSCNAPDDPRGAIEQFVTMRDMLNSTGRHIFYALCGWAPWYAQVGAVLGNSWRVARDLNGFRELWNTLSINARLAPFAGPGAWNDPDGLVGSANPARVMLTESQSRTQFSLWCIMAAPLFLGGNPAEMSPFDVETYTNKEAIEINQDPLGRQGNILWQNCPVKSVAALVREANASDYTEPPMCQQVWGRPLYGGDWAVAMVNWAEANVVVKIGTRELLSMGFGSGAHFRDLWAKADLGTFLQGFHADVEGIGGSKFFRLSPQRLLV